jgi:dTDP-4-dehydrorhamnose reductase
MESNRRPQRIAVSGATGLLGRVLVPRLASRGHAVIAGRHQSGHDVFSGVTSISLDLLDPDSVAHFVDQAEANWVIHAAALTDVDRCEHEPELASAINTEATGHLVRAMVRTPSRLVFLSTDYVFDGTSGPYDETASEAPINVYGRTKLAAERLIQTAGQEHVIIRSASFLGIGLPGRPTFAEKMVQTMRESPPLLAAIDQCSNITPVEFLAAWIIEIIETAQSGVRHIAGDQILSRLDFALRLARLFELRDDAVRAVHFHELRRTARRPLNGGLITRFALSTPPIPLGAALADWKDTLVRGTLIK